MEISENKNRLLELDALRGIAAVLVILCHHTMFNRQAGFGFKYGVTGVDLFFMISGFVIFLSLKNTSSWKQFVVNRLARLYPVYWVCVSITAAIMFYFHFSNNERFVVYEYLVNLTMLQYYFRVGDLDGPYWTLIIEMLFYGSILLVFLFKKLGKIELIGYAVLLFSLVYDLVIQKRAPEIYNLINKGFPLINHFPLFFAGILFYKMKFEKQDSYKSYIGLFACFVLACLLFDNGGRAKIFLAFYEYMIILFSYFFIWILYVNNELLWIISKPTLFLGKISYSLYLIHQYLSTRLIIPELMKNYNVPFWLSSIIAFAACVGIATLITFYVEKPSVRYFKKLVKNK